MKALTACPLCESPRFAVVERHRRDPYADPALEIRTVACETCGLFFQNPQLEERDLKAMYTGDYAGVRRGRPTDYYLFRKSLGGEARYQWLSRRGLLGPAQPGRRVLDIGSAAGHTLVPFKHAGWHAVGLEPTTHYAEFARREYGLEVVQGMLEDTRFEAPFDVIVLGQTLEHLADPGRVFEAIKACLAPGGLLYIDVPNICYPTFWRLGRFLRAEHLFHYSPRTLRLTLRKHGFDPIEIEADLWLRTAARVGGRGAIDYAKEGDRWREIARLFPRRFLTVATLRGKAFIRSAVYGTLGYEGGQRLLTRLRGGAEAHRS